MDFDGVYEAAISDADFMGWLTQFAPDWRVEYSGNVVAMYAAWQASRVSAQTVATLKSEN